MAKTAARRKNERFSDEERRALIKSFDERGDMSIGEWSQSHDNLSTSLVYVWKKKFGLATSTAARGKKGAKPKNGVNGSDPVVTGNGHSRGALIEPRNLKNAIFNLRLIQQRIDSTGLKNDDQLDAMNALKALQGHL